MLRDLLERRFQLKVHIETEQIPAWAMTVAPGRPQDEGGDLARLRPPRRQDAAIATAARYAPYLEAARRGAARSRSAVRRWEQRPNNVFVGGGRGLYLPLGGILGAPVID